MHLGVLSFFIAKQPENNHRTLMILAMKSRQQCLLTSRICLFEAQRLLSTSKFYVRQAARPNFNLMMPYKVEVEVEVVEEDSRKL